MYLFHQTMPVHLSPSYPREQIVLECRQSQHGDLIYCSYYPPVSVLDSILSGGKGPVCLAKDTEPEKEMVQ